MNSRGCALVYGGTGAIGGSIVAALADRVPVVATFCSRQPNRTGLAKWIRYSSEDVSSGSSDIAAAISSTGEPLRALFYCIGSPSTKAPITETRLDEFVELCFVNALLFVAAYQAVAPAAREGQAGVVLLSSDATASSRRNNGAYTASKAALEAIAVTLAQEEAEHGVRINVLAPSLVESPMGELILGRKGVENSDLYYSSLAWGRALKPEEVGRAAIGLALDDEWRYMSGQVVRLAARV